MTHDTALWRNPQHVAGLREADGVTLPLIVGLDSRTTLKLIVAPPYTERAQRVRFSPGRRAPRLLLLSEDSHPSDCCMFFKIPAGTQASVVAYFLKIRLGTIRTTTINDAFDPALWETFFSTTLGLEVPVLSFLPRHNNSTLAKCGCKKTPLGLSRRPHKHVHTQEHPRRTIGWSPCSTLSAARLDTRSATKWESPLARVSGAAT